MDKAKDLGAPGAPAARTTLVIDRSKWMRGRGHGTGRLLDEMETVFARGHGETYQCIECRGGP